MIQDVEAIKTLQKPEYLETVSCNLCQTSKQSLWAECLGFNIMKCDSCGLVYVNPRLNKLGLQEAYGQTYYAMHTEMKALEKRMSMYDIEIREIKKMKSSGKILDVGCGGGFFLSKFGNEWEKYGTEFNPVAAEAARKNFGLNVKVGELPSLEYPSNFFDVVNLRGVIEHFLDPFAYLQESYRILKPGGIIAINTPNIGSFCAELYKEKFCLVTPIQHIYYFSTKTMSQMLEKANFKIDHTKYFYLGTPYAQVSDFPKVLGALIKRGLNQKIESISPAFFDNVLHIYAVK